MSERNTTPLDEIGVGILIWTPIGAGALVWRDAATYEDKEIAPVRDLEACARFVDSVADGTIGTPPPTSHETTEEEEAADPSECSIEELEDLAELGGRLVVVKFGGKVAIGSELETTPGGASGLVASELQDVSNARTDSLIASGVTGAVLGLLVGAVFGGLAYKARKFR